MKFFRRPSKAPLLRDEFPIATEDKRHVSRRQITKFLTLTSLAMFVGSVWILLRVWLQRKPYFPERVVARAGEIPTGAFKIFQYPTENDPCILLRTARDTYVAYSRVCTHLSCAVFYEQDQDCLFCPCHGGYFSVKDGSVLQGPPPRPLPQVVMEQRGADLVAKGIRVS